MARTWRLFYATLLYTFVINILAVTLCFLISLPFPVNCCFLNW